jgi:hypothetical protein
VRRERRVDVSCGRGFGEWAKREVAGDARTASLIADTLDTAAARPE